MFSLRSVALVSLVALGSLSACTLDYGQDSDDVTDVDHTDVERQSIGNCWLYAQASWAESMHLRATGEHFDTSQSYWTYWHWYGEITGYMWGDEISTGGNQWTSNEIVLDRGLMREADFVPEDETGEMSDRQADALAKVNEELKSGRLKSEEARRDPKLVREVLDEAWGLSEAVREQLSQVFGEDGKATLREGASIEGTTIVDPTTFAVRYPQGSEEGFELVDTTLDVAIGSWETASYPSSSWGDEDLSAERRNFLIRVQRALHAQAPVVITWDVDFNALENDPGDLQGSFNLETLAEAGGPGNQGGHMTVLEDYQVVTEEFGLLAAGVTLDPNDPEDAAKLDAALLPGSQIVFLRIKNSWGALRPDREFAPDFPGYHDLYLDYLDGPIDWCPAVENKTADNCNGTSTPLDSVMLPPGF